MQIIQTLREKVAWLMVILLVLAMFSFIMMDANSTCNKSGNDIDPLIAVIGGKNVRSSDFNVFKNMAIQNAQNQQRPINNEDIEEAAFSDLKTYASINTQAEKIGIKYFTEQFNKIISSNSNANPLKQAILDESTGKISIDKLKQLITNLKQKKKQGDAGNPQLENLKQQVSEVILPQFQQTSIAQRYFSLLSTAAYTPKWQKKLEEEDGSKYATISYVAIPYNKISDSTVTVTDKDLENFVEQNKKEYKQEGGRYIAYLPFSIRPTSKDSNDIRAELLNLKSSFLSDTNTKTFVTKNSKGSVDLVTYFTENDLGKPVFDAIKSAGVGGVTDVILDGNSFILCKNLGASSVPSMLTTQHILLNVKDGNYTVDAAIKLADSLINLIKNGSDMSELAKKYSNDPGSANKGGIYDSITKQTGFEKSYLNYVFSKPIGEVGKIYTSYGVHVIRATKVIKSEPGFRVAKLSRPIVASAETSLKAENDANKAFKESKGDYAKLKEYTAKNNLQIVSFINIPGTLPVKESDSRVGSLSQASELVRWAYKQSKAGVVGAPITIGEDKIVPILEKIQKEGSYDLGTAKQQLLDKVRNEKKGDVIIKKLGDNVTLESAAAAYEGGQIVEAGLDSSITMISSVIGNLGMEPKVVGGAFNPNNLGKVSKPVKGNIGVVVFKTNAINKKEYKKPNPFSAPGMPPMGNKNYGANMFDGSGWIVNGILKNVEVKDKRFK